VKQRCVHTVVAFRSAMAHGSSPGCFVARAALTYVVLGGLLFLSMAVQAQRSSAHQTSIWLAYTTQLNVAPKWNAQLEAQWRRSHWGVSPQQALLRSSLSYQSSAKVQWAGGFILLHNSPYGAYPAKSTFPEFRTWEQVQFRGAVQHWDTWLRLRLEQRWLYSPVLTGAHYAPGEPVYTNRIRVMNKWNHSLGGTPFKTAAFYMSFFDEFFFSFGKNVKYNMFDQNRIGLALGHKISSTTSLEFGYMLQSIIKLNGMQVEHNHTMSVACLSNLNLQRKGK
jgi:hypothetical protein